MEKKKKEKCKWSHQKPPGQNASHSCCECTALGKNFRFFSFFVTSKKFSKSTEIGPLALPPYQGTAWDANVKILQLFYFLILETFPGVSASWGAHFSLACSSWFKRSTKYECCKCINVRKRIVQKGKSFWKCEVHCSSVKNNLVEVEISSISFASWENKMLVSSPLFHIWFTFLNGFLFSLLIHQVENILMALIHQWNPKNLSHWPHGRDLGQMLTHFSDLRTISILMLNHQGIKGRHVGLVLFLGHWSGYRVRLWCKSSSQGGLSPAQRVCLHGLEPEKIRWQLSYTNVMNLVCPLLLSNSTLMALSPRSPPLGPFVQEQIPMTLPFTSTWLWITPGLHSENDSVALTIFKRMNVLFVLKNKAPSAKYKLDFFPTSSYPRRHHIQASVKYTVTILERQTRWDKHGQKWELNLYHGEQVNLYQQANSDYTVRHVRFLLKIISQL